MNMSKNANSVNTSSKGSTKTIALVGLMAALTCIMGPLSVPLPFSPVPISLTNLAVYLAVYVLGMKWGTVSYCIYLLIGFVGVPVFSSFTGGAGKLLGPTGGYLIGFAFMALICGFFIDKWTDKMPLCFLGLALGTLCCYAVETLWLARQAGLSLPKALAAGVLPFVFGDILKIVAAMAVGPQIRKRLRAAGLG